jgi:hypothetical protein
MSMALVPQLPVNTFGSQAHAGFDDFDWYISPHLWTSSVGTAVVGSLRNGVLAVAPAAATDNLECYVNTTASPFTIVANKPLMVEYGFQYSEAATSAANIAVGFMNAVATAALIDNGGGPKASFSGAVIYKIDGGTVWRCRSSVGTTNNDSITSLTAGGSAYVRLRIEIRPVSATIAEVTYWFNNYPSDGSAITSNTLGQMLDATTGKPIKHSLTYTSAAAMQIVTLVKNGSANVETLNLDYITWAQSR